MCHEHHAEHILTDFDRLAVLDPATYHRGGPPLQP
jgi:hypothetical protein